MQLLVGYLHLMGARNTYIFCSPSFARSWRAFLFKYFRPESSWKPLFFLNHTSTMQTFAILVCLSSSGCFLAFVMIIVKSVISPFFESFLLFFASTMGASDLTCLSQHKCECSRMTSSGYYCVFNPVWAF